MAILDKDSLGSSMLSTDTATDLGIKDGSSVCFSEDEMVSNRYKIIEVLGSGSYGIVYKAFDLKLKSLVALKALRNDELGDSDFLLKLFYREVRNAQALTHRNLCRVYDLGEDRGRHYFSMAYAEGQDLRKYLLKKQRLEKSEVIAIASQLCEGLEELHKEGFLHRDLKPENIIRGYDGKVQITDFGLVELAAESQSGLLVGTRPYMAPEILNRSEATQSSDIYSLGVILYELIAGKLPFTSPERHALLREIEKGPVPLGVLVEDVDECLEEMILSCLAFNPKSRPSAAKEIEARLATVVRDNSYAHNPFISDRAVRGVNFLGNAREYHIKVVLGRIARKQSTFVVGDLRTGKTSFLLRLADRIESELGNVMVHSCSLQSASQSFMPADFWNDAIESVLERFSDSKVLKAARAAAKYGYTQTRLENLFAKIFAEGYTLVLLLDEFEYLLQHPNFPANFFALLRSLVMSAARALVVIPTSRFPMNEIEKKSLDLKRQVSSRYFNYFTEIDLSSLGEESVADLLSLSGPHFTAPDKFLVRTLAGRQPYLLQMCAEILFNAAEERRWFKSAEHFYDRSVKFFDDLWRGWSDECRSVAIFLLLAEWSQRVLGQPLAFSSSKLSKNDVRVGLKELARAALLGVVDEVSNLSIRYKFNWGGEFWGLGAETFVWWFKDLALLRTRDLDGFLAWLSALGERPENILEQADIDRIKRLSEVMAGEPELYSVGCFVANFPECIEC